MTDGWRDLRKADRDLAFSLLFAPATRRNLLADRLLLAHEAETAIRLASNRCLPRYGCNGGTMLSKSSVTKMCR